MSWGYVKECRHRKGKPPSMHVIRKAERARCAFCGDKDGRKRGCDAVRRLRQCSAGSVPIELMASRHIEEQVLPCRQIWKRCAI